jgi:hypothetical protein
MNRRQTLRALKGYRQTPMGRIDNQLRQLTVEGLATDELEVEFVELGNFAKTSR